jgi:hypothetical protein
MLRTALLSITLSTTALAAVAQVAVTDSAVNGRGTYVNPNVPTVEATDANGVPLTAFVTVLNGDAPDGPQMLTTLFAAEGYLGASMESMVLPNRGACIEAGAGQLRVLLLSRPQSRDEGIEQGSDGLNMDMLDVSSFQQWVQVACQPLTQMQ